MGIVQGSCLWVFFDCSVVINLLVSCFHNSELGKGTLHWHKLSCQESFSPQQEPDLQNHSPTLFADLNVSNANHTGQRVESWGESKRQLCHRQRTGAIDNRTVLTQTDSNGCATTVAVLADTALTLEGGFQEGSTVICV